MSCPANSLHGFVQFNTNKLTDDQLKSIRPSLSESAAPFMINYAPRSTPLSFDGPNSSFIIEDQQNTLLFKGVVYTIKSVKLCNNSSSIYKNADHTLIYTFVSQYMETAINTFTASIQQGKTPLGISSLTAGTPLVIILIIPIYYTNSTNPVNDTYLMQLTNPTTASSYPNMKTLFTGQKSIMYGACFDVDINSTIFGLTANVYNFIPGITTTLQNWNSILYVKNGLQNAIRPIGPYIFDDGIQFINKYTTGQPDTTNKSTSFMSLPVMDPGDSKFKNQFIYYADDIGTSSKSLKPALIPSNQYQCYPFSELTNLDKAQNVSLDRIIQKDSESSSIPSAPTVWQIIGICVGIVVLLLIILAIFLYRNSTGASIPTTGAAAVVGAPAPAPPPAPTP